ncbi:MAG: CBS domain-containing protein [Nitrospinota bacterium]|nr:CBS domain-containing protein [Nitrospinota bacterium]
MQEKDPKEKVKDFMSSPVNSDDFNATIQDPAQIMSTKNVSAILIKENEEYVGIVTERDFTRRTAGEGVDPKTAKISTIVGQPFNTMDLNQHVSQANEFMHDNYALQ